MKASGAVAALGSMAGLGTGASSQGVREHSQGDVLTDVQDAPSPGSRIETGLRVSPRDFESHNYERIYSHRKKEALQVLLADPEVNAIVREWILSFAVHEPLTNHVDMISVQGPRDIQIEGGLDSGTFEITAVDRQVAYGLVDRYANELLALQLSEARDVSWEESFDETGVARGRLLMEQPEVSDFLEGKQWFPSFKVAESITAYQDFPHGEASPIAIHVKEDGEMTMLSTFIDVTDPENPQFVDAVVVEDYVEFPAQKIARDITPNDESVLGTVPQVPFEKRPYYSANNGFHRIEEPPQSFEQNGWQIEWQPPETQGITMKAQYNGKPVFAAMNNPSTYTGYALPPREGRNTLDWYFPDHNTVFTGHLLFWDIHSVDFGGPGMLGKIDYPARAGHPGGFRLKTHYHTGAQEKSSVDFHSGFQFGPYNYDISFEYFEDGAMRPIWRRQGPGYVMEHNKHLDEVEWGEGEEMVVQHYVSATAFDVTPGTTEGAVTQYFDGDEWVTPDEEFYLEGEPGTKIRFCNPSPSSPERVEIPLNRDVEVVVVRPHEDEIGAGEGTATRVFDAEAEKAFYHPAQYVDGEAIQGERVNVWLLLEAATGEMPHPSNITSFAAVGEIQLKGYDGEDGC